MRVQYTLSVLHAYASLLWLQFYKLSDDTMITICITLDNSMKLQVIILPDAYAVLSMYLCIQNNKSTTNMVAI